jgi:hypothetical protein
MANQKRNLARIVKNGLRRNKMTTENTNEEMINQIEDDVKFQSFTLNEDPRNSVSVIYHACNYCGNKFRVPVMVTALDTQGVDDSIMEPVSAEDIPVIICGNHTE